MERGYEPAACSVCIVQFALCTNMEEMEAVDKAVLEVDEMNVALTRSELASK